MGIGGNSGNSDWDINVNISPVEGIEQEGIGTEHTTKDVPPASITKSIGGLFATIAAVRGKPFWKLEKTECDVLKANEKSVSGILPVKWLAKFGIISFGIVLISAIVRRVLRDLREVGDSREDEDEDYEEPEQKYSEEMQKIGRF